MNQIDYKSNKFICIGRIIAGKLRGLEFWGWGASCNVGANLQDFSGEMRHIIIPEVRVNFVFIFGTAPYEIKDTF